MPAQTGTAGLPRPADRIAHLDAWRFFAVAGVIVGHSMGQMVARGVIVTEGWIWQLARVAPLGVDIFFFISGFVICRGLLREQEGTGAVSLRAFYVRRAFRILPPLALYLATIAVLGPGLHWIDATAVDLLRSALFVCNLHPLFGKCSWWVGHTWSLGFEEQFYILFPLLFVLLGLGRGVVKKEWILWIALIALACSGLWVRAFARGFPVFYASNAAFLATGCGAAMLEPRIRDLAVKVSARAWLLLLIAALAVFIGLPLSQYNVVHLVMPLPILFFVLTTPMRQPAVRAIFENPAIGHLGRISYTVYLWQQLALGGWHAVPTAALPLLIVAVFCWAAWSWRHIESPLIQTGRKISARLIAGSPVPKRCDG